MEVYRSKGTYVGAFGNFYNMLNYTSSVTTPIAIYKWNEGYQQTYRVYNEVQTVNLDMHFKTNGKIDLYIKYFQAKTKQKGRNIEDSRHYFDITLSKSKKIFDYMMKDTIKNDLRRKDKK